MHRKNSNPNIGPSTYDTDARVHKELMTALYPKKKAPFNQTEIRESPLVQPQSMRDLPGNSNFHNFPFNISQLTNKFMITYSSYCC